MWEKQGRQDKKGPGGVLSQEVLGSARTGGKDPTVREWANPPVGVQLVRPVKHLQRCQVAGWGGLQGTLGRNRKLLLPCFPEHHTLLPELLEEQGRNEFSTTFSTMKQ